MDNTFNIDTLRDFASKTMIPNSEVWLYGSRARNDYRANSDWDLLVLLNKDKITTDDFDRFGYSFILFGSQFSEDINPQLYTFREWEDRKITPYYQNVEHDKLAIY